MRANRPIQLQRDDLAQQVHLHIRHLALESDVVGGALRGGFEGALAHSLQAKLSNQAPAWLGSHVPPSVEPVATEIAAQVRPLLDSGRRT